MHVNMSLFKNDENMFFDNQGEMGLSEIAYQFTAGIIKHATGFTAITNSIVNSYKRLVPGYEAPCYVAWSGLNRSPLVRVPSSRGLSTRIEVRSVDPAANPYMALAVLLASGLDGIENKLSPPVSIDKNIYEMDKREREQHGIEDLPATLMDALDELQKNNMIIESLGDHLYEHFIEAKTMEWDTFRTTVHPWEREQYLTSY